MQVSSSYTFSIRSISFFLLLGWLSPLQSAVPAVPEVTLDESLTESCIRFIENGPLEIRGRIYPAIGKIESSDTSTSPGDSSVSPSAKLQVRVTNACGKTSTLSLTVSQSTFVVHFPDDFPDADSLTPGLYYVDATNAADFGGPECIEHESSLLLVAINRSATYPDLSLVFTDDFIDSTGMKDRASMQWERNRRLVNQFMDSRAAWLSQIARKGFDLNNPDDFAWFKNNASLYDFDHRDRDWSVPLNNRVSRGFWQAVWNSWFNASNDHPWDGNPSNHAQSNFRPFTFTNDPADLLVMYQRLRSVPRCIEDNRDQLSADVLRNLLASQHDGEGNFALKEVSGLQEFYTAGAFRYGMFETGEWLTEGTGWFHNPTFRDFARGGVFNGRAIWAIGESLRASRDSDLTDRCKTALQRSLQYCLRDALVHGYAYKTKTGDVVWSRIAGEHAYMVLGMLAACEAYPDLPLFGDEATSPSTTLKELTRDSLDALADIADPNSGWTHYANSTAMNIAALSTGCLTFGVESNPRWVEIAESVANTWLELTPDPKERSIPTPMFASRNKEGYITFFLGKAEHAHVPLYIGGHWIQALSVLSLASNNPLYARRADQVFAYYCGTNPLRVRLLNEIGAIHNRVTDFDGDGIEETLGWDAYPESTAFVQIGLLYLIDAQRRFSQPTGPGLVE